MLALEPNAKVFSSTTTNPGLPEVGPFQVGEFDTKDGDSSFISQRAYYEGGVTSLGKNYFSAWPIETKDGLSYIPWLLDLYAKNLLRADPHDTTSTKFQITFKLHIAYPAAPGDASKLGGTGLLPVVALVHGAHSAERPSRLGYIYLQQELARWGIVSVSVDGNAANGLDSLIEMRAENALKALDAMKKMNDDTTSLFYQRLDLDNVGMMGHSRGGDAVVRAAIINENKNARIDSAISRKYGIKAVCSLAPTDFAGLTAAYRRQMPASSTVPFLELSTALDKSHCDFYAVVYGALDGDVSGFDGATGGCATGFRHYDRATTHKSMVFLDSCNHNRFNDVWADDGDDSDMLTADIENRLAAAARSDFQRQYSKFLEPCCKQ